MPELEPLFPDEFAEAQEAPTNPAHIMRNLYAIKAIHKKQEEIQHLLEECIHFYKHKLEAYDKAVDFLTGSIDNFMKANSMEKIPTPAGTVYYETRTSHTLPDDQILLEWITHQTEDVKQKLMRTKMEINRKAVMEHIKTTGDLPLGYSEEEVTKLRIRDNV